MPYAVIPKANPLQDATAGLTGALKGATEGMQYNEQVRQAKDASETQKRQFADEMAFKLHNLKIMQSEGLLTRQQEERMKVMDEAHQKETQKIDNTFKGGENTRDRTLQWNTSIESNKTQRIGDIRQQQAQNNATRQREKEADTQAAQADQQHANEMKLTAVGQIRSKYGDPSTWTPEVRAQAEGEYLRTIHAPGQIDQAGLAVTIPQATQQQDIADLNALAPDAKYHEEITRLGSERETAALAEARGRAVGGNSANSPVAIAVGSVKEPRTVNNIIDRNKPPNVATGVYELDLSQLPPAAVPVTIDIDSTILSRAQPILLQNDKRGQKMMRDALQNEVNVQVDALPGVSEDMKSALKARYQSAIYNSTDINYQQVVGGQADQGTGMVGESGE